MPNYPSTIPSDQTIIRGSKQSGSGGGLSHPDYDDQVLAEIAAMATDMVGDGDPAGLKGTHDSLKARLDAENGRYEYTHDYSPAGNSLTPNHGLNTWFVEVIMQKVSTGVTIKPGYTAGDQNGITINQSDVPFNQGDSIRVLIRAL